MSNFRLNSPPIYCWQQLAKYVYNSLCNMIRAQNEPPLATKIGIKILR